MANKGLLDSRLLLLFLALACLGLYVSCGGAGPRHGSGPQQFDYFRMVDGIHNLTTIRYAYAPWIILQNNVYHVFFCSMGVPPAWDYIPYVNSSDGGKTWSS